MMTVLDTARDLPNQWSEQVARHGARSLSFPRRRRLQNTGVAKRRREDAPRVGQLLLDPPNLLLMDEPDDASSTIGSIDALGGASRSTKAR
jgi:hypothetical protein